MTTAPSLSGRLRSFYAAESAQIQQVAAGGNGRALIERRTALLDSVVTQLWKDLISPELSGPPGFAMVAIGGFGRRWLFPHSDVDLLFLHEHRDGEQLHKDTVRRFCQELWDMRMRLSPTTRALAECDRFDSNNTEFTISLLDCRYLAGDSALFRRLHDELIPKLIARESQTLLQSLGEVTRQRHARFSSTVFHLEPNIKDMPGGLRDHNVAYWLALISAIHKLRQWPDPQALLPESTRKQLDGALDFLCSVRCFLHFRHSRDDNTLTWEAQDAAAASGVGIAAGGSMKAAEWMKMYFHHARTVHRRSTQLLDEVAAASSSLHRQFQTWRSRLSNADFSVVDGSIYLRQPSALKDHDLLLRTFEFLARHGLRLSATTEQRIEQVLPSIAATPPRGGELWMYLSEILAQPHAAGALRAMHSLRLLTILLPELEVFDCLVVRDFHHRYTVDEHSFLTIDGLHRLRQSKSDWDKGFREILEELAQPELLYLALLLHDTGKGVPGDDHVAASLEIAERCFRCLDLDASDADTVRFLIGSHLEMSEALRRDTSDAATLSTFCDKIGTPERLKMLTLLTYADIKAVNPEALTPWKAENIWRLYVVASNHMNRSLDERFHANADDEVIARLHSLAPASTKKTKTFLEGLPKRYFQAHPAHEILEQVAMAERVSNQPVQIELKRNRHWYELTLVTKDRPALFASVTGALAAWGMNIVKADAFSNQARMVVDRFYFTDRFRTLELNVSEWERFKGDIAAVIEGRADLDRMLRDRLKNQKSVAAKVPVPTRVDFDGECSSNSTLLQIVAQDRPGLLHRISSCLSRHDCNIEIALIDTEGQMAIDVFYLTSGGAKLTADKQKKLVRALNEELDPVL